MNDERERRSIGSSATTPRERGVVFRRVALELERLALQDNNPQSQTITAFLDDFRSNLVRCLTDEGLPFNPVRVVVPTEIRSEVTECLVDSYTPKNLYPQGVTVQGTHIRGLYFLSERGEQPNQRIYSIVGVNHVPGNN